MSLPMLFQVIYTELLRALVFGRKEKKKMVKLVGVKFFFLPHNGV